MRRFAVLTVAALISLPIFAQNIDIESVSGLQFNLGNPGARSLGMGGAFLGLADDASAAEANPAGLTILRKPEISVEGRNYLTSQVLTTSGTYPDLSRTAFSNYSDRVTLSFASIVVPIGSNFTVGAYYHEPLRNSGQGSVFARQDPLTGQITEVPDAWFNTGGSGPVSQEACLAAPDCFHITIKPFVTLVDIKEQTFALAGAVKIGTFSIGATGRYQRFEEQSLTFRFTQDPDTRALTPDGVSVQATSPANVLKQQSEHDITFAAGIKWAPIDKFSLGAVYKKGATFNAPTFDADATTNGPLVFTPTAPSQFHFPDIYGVGVSIRPIPVLTINADADRVLYSHLSDNFFSISTDLQPIANNFKTDDVTELHLGAEYFFQTSVPFALRGGYWRDPAHSVEWRGPLNGSEQIAAAILFPKGQDQNHFSIGAGFAWPKFQIDAAYDQSKYFKVGSLSFVTRF